MLFGGSGQALQAYRVVRDVFLQVRKDQEQFEHAVAKLEIRLGGFFQIVDDGQSIGEQPFELGFVDGAAIAAQFERVIGAQKRFIEKMAQAEALGCQRSWNRIRALDPPASPRSGRGHTVLLNREVGPKDVARAYHRSAGRRT
jgi:hypothetical protein